MIPIDTRVKCVSVSALALYGKSGTVVASNGNKVKVLFDKDKAKSRDPLADAYWFYTSELETL